MPECPDMWRALAALKRLLGVRTLVSFDFAEIAKVFRGFGKFACRTLMMR
jgi:hypothetical protein